MIENNTYQFVEIEIADRIGILYLNRPKKRNALNDQFVNELKQVLHEMEQNEKVKVVIIKAKGEAFCAGADLAYLQKLQNYSYEENLQDSLSLKELFELIYKYEKIIIAQVEGHALAGGAGIATVCDFIFSVPEAKFGFTEVKIGFVPALVSFFLIRKIGEARSRELLLTGSLISADKAKETGLINEVITSSEIGAFVSKFARKLVEETSGESIKTTRQIISEVQHLSQEEALNKLAEINAKARESKDCILGIDSFLNKRKIEW